MNITNFRAVQDKGLVEIKKYGPDYVIVKRQFDADTGVEKAPVQEAFKREQLLVQMEAHQAAIVELTACIAAIDALG